MARQPSKILTAAELKTQKADLKAEIAAHSSAIKHAEKAVAAAKKELNAVNKATEAAFAKAQKGHVAALKAASKAYEVVQKTHAKTIDSANKLGAKAEARVAALTPTAKETATA